VPSAPARRLLVVQHEPESPPALLGEVAAALGLDLAVVEAPAEPLPTRLDGAAGLAVLGGEMGVYDAADYPHLEATMALLRQAAAGGVPALGICLGAQLAAHALGGRAYLGDAGVEAGWNRLELAPGARADPVLGSLGAGDAVFHWHKDTFDLPPGATLLASTDRYANQAFRAGSVVGVQWHPEVDAGILAAWYAASPAPYPHEAALAGVAEHGPAARRLLEAFCRVVAGGP
jgi:GMP synthase (glutamine-hydrolysing)